MLSIKQVRLVEANWEEIARRLIAAVRKHPDMQTLAKLPDIELREWCREILENLSYLLSAKTDEEVTRRFQELGQVRFEEKVPLHEAVLRMQTLRGKIVGFLHEQGYPMTAMQLFAQEELEQRLGRLFDALVYGVVRGYEKAMRVAVRMAS